jgi:Leucine-rich repeat (LRR) protein
LVTLDLSDNYFYDLELENPNLKVFIQNLSALMELHLDSVLISAQGSEWCQALSFSLPNLRVLSLSSCNLSGPIDSSLQNLQSLSIIRLNDNDFSTPVPEFFADFKKLTSLEVSNSWLNGKFLEKIFKVPTLQTLELSYNYELRGSLPEFPPNGSLRTMFLIRTSFYGALPSSIGNLKMLSTIDLESCNFVGSIPNSMASLTQLKFLDISHNKLNGSIPNFSMCKNLTTVRLYNNYFSGEIISAQWEKLLNLETLELRSNLLNGNIPDSLFSLPSLQMLDLSYNQFSGQLKEFSNASSFLEYLFLDNNHLEGPIPMSISELHGLKELSLGSNKFNNTMNLSVIQQLKNLSSLDLSHTNLLSEYNDFNFSLSSVPLNELILAFCKLKKILDFLRNQSYLYYLDLSYNQIFGEMPNWI